MTSRARSDRFTAPRLLTGLVAVATLTGVLVAPQAAVPATAHEGRGSAGSAGVGDPYFPLDGNGGIDVAHYDIRNDYDFASGLLVGRTRLTLTPTRDLARFNLDLLLRPTSVTIDGRKAAFRKDGKHELVITPSAPLEAGRGVDVVVRHRGKPASISYLGEKSWFSHRHEVVSVNQPHIAPWWFAANDHPSDKATFSIATSVPKGKQVVSNGRLVKKTRAGDRVVWHWKARDPMATYLAFFAAGDYTVERGTSHGLPWVVAVSERLDPGTRRRSLTQLKKSASYVRWLEKHLGPYPFETTGGISVGFDLGFALENQTRPIYPGFWWKDPSLVIHELAHQWVGDSVALERWQDIWINEGLATFMEYRRLEAVTGISAQRQVDALWDTHPPTASIWQVAPGRPGAKNIFHQSVYERGGATVQALRTRIGEQDFRVLLKTWTQRHAHGNASSVEFEELAEEISGEDLESFFDAWLRTRARPSRTTANGFLPR